MIVTPDAILEAVDGLRDELVQRVCDLVRFHTLRLSGQDFLACAEYLADAYEQVGLDAEILPVPPDEVAALSGPDSHYRRLGLNGALAPRWNVLARRRGQGNGPSLHLNGHYCIVEPVDGWTADPFEPVLRDGRIVGRGTIDMKGGLAVVVAALQALQAAGVRQDGDLVASATVDTHFGGNLGAGFLATRGLGRADRVIVTDTSGPGCILLGYRGQLWAEVRILGRSAHGGAPFYGSNPVPAAAEVILALERHREELSRRESTLPFVPAEARHPSLTVGTMLRSASMINLVPSECRIGIDRRLIPEESADSAEAEIDAALEPVRIAYPDVRIALHRLFAAPPTATPASDPLVVTLARNVHRITGRAARLVLHPAFLDLQWFTRCWNVPGVVYGPGDGGVNSGFRQRPYAEPDESVAVDDLIAATKVLALSIAELTADRPSTARG